jgi:hypothetical protein
MKKTRLILLTAGLALILAGRILPCLVLLNSYY